MLAGLGCVSAMAAADEMYRPMKVIQTEAVIYPRRVLDLGINHGYARVTVQIDEHGKLTDHLVTGYSHEAFAQAAVVALKNWRYEPAWLRGEPYGATSDLTFHFESQGMVVVDLTVSRYVELRDYQLRPNAYTYGVKRMSELDQIPTPSKVVTPVYPVEPSQTPRAATVAVTFYIDENGKVRLPTVSREASEHDGIFARAAVDAVSQWEFEPPRSGGVPVLVLARQEFHFRPDHPVATGGTTASRTTTETGGTK
jgi:TonB family C-terminal domain